MSKKKKTGKWPEGYPDILKQEYRYIDLPGPNSWKNKVTLNEYAFPTKPQERIQGEPILLLRESVEIDFPISDLIHYISNNLVVEPFDAEKHTIELDYEHSFYYDSDDCYVLIKVFDNRGKLNPYYEEEMEKYEKEMQILEEEKKLIHKIRRVWGKWCRERQAEYDVEELERLKAQAENLKKQIKKREEKQK